LINQLSKQNQNQTQARTCSSPAKSRAKLGPKKHQTALAISGTLAPPRLPSGQGKLIQANRQTTLKNI